MFIRHRAALAAMVESARMARPMLVLASESPRRQELLRILGVPFRVVPPTIDESPRAGELPMEFVARLARDKATEVAGRVSGSVVISADTAVAVGGEILGKPADSEDAVRMLEKLSGRRHSVYTGVFVVNQVKGSVLEGIDRTDVWFKPLTDPLIRDYIRRENVMDKAGAYAIQGYAAVFIPKIEGNYANVMGLPLPLIHELLCRTLS